MAPESSVPLPVCSACSRPAPTPGHRVPAGLALPAPVDVFLFARHLLCVNHWECSREKNRALEKRAGPHT